jgi:hypothetical protein
MSIEERHFRRGWRFEDIGPLLYFWPFDGRILHVALLDSREEFLQRRGEEIELYPCA